MTQRATPNLVGALALAIAAVASSPLNAPLSAQTHKVSKPETVVRAVGVYEWIGDMAKPTASRLIPVSLFIDNKLEDAGVYLARPVPLALLTGNVYELDQAGVVRGTVDLLYARHLIASDSATTTYDDGWFAYGQYVPPPVPKKSTLKPSRNLPVVISSNDDSRPHFSSKSAAPGSGDAAKTVPGTTSTSDAPPDDPDRPTMKRHADAQPASSGTGNTDTTGTASPTTTDTPPADPDRPTMKRQTDTSGQTASPGSSTSSDRDSPPDDPDRPTLRRRTPEQAKKAAAAADQARVTDVGSLNDDPNRPMLHRGKPAGVPTLADFPKLSGLPGEQDLHQMVAVSDAANRPAHDFSRPWDDEAEHQAILAKMQAAARTQLAAYEAANSPKPAVPAPKPDTRTPNSKIRRPAVADPAPPPPEPLLDEQLKGYMLSYGGAPTYVYSAHTDGLGPAQRFVTLVAQVNMQGEPEIALKSVTDAAHLDRTPRYCLVDVVDAEASNRASLLFELRAQNSRQFALYRVLGARADQTFLTGSTQ